MAESRALFVTGPTRSGTTLLSVLLSAHSQVMVASDPALPFFRSLRNSMVAQRGADDLRAWFQPDWPLQDYYFDRMRIRLLDLALGSDLNVELDPADRERMIESVQGRARHRSPDLIPAASHLQGATYGEFLQNLLAAISSVRNAADRRWVGMKEVWVVDSIPALARSLPDARFIVIMRDPRAIAASLANQAKEDPDERAHTLSSARHWRKYVALAACTFSSDPLLSRRVCLIKYEDLMMDPRAQCARICNFLDVDFEAAMLDPVNWYDYATQGPFMGNSSYEKRLRALDPGLTARWRRSLDPSLLALIELICGPEMALMGYPAELASDAWTQSAKSLQEIVTDDLTPSSWRSDLQNPLIDYGLELTRHAMLASPNDSPADAVRQSFLFDEVYRLCRSRLPLLARSSGL